MWIYLQVHRNSIMISMDTTLMRLKDCVGAAVDAYNLHAENVLRVMGEVWDLTNSDPDFQMNMDIPFYKMELISLKQYFDNKNKTPPADRTTKITVTGKEERASTVMDKEGKTASEQKKTADVVKSPTTETKTDEVKSTSTAEGNDSRKKTDVAKKSTSAAQGTDSGQKTDVAKKATPKSKPPIVVNSGKDVSGGNKADGGSSTEEEEEDRSVEMNIQDEEVDKDIEKVGARRQTKTESFRKIVRASKSKKASLTAAQALLEDDVTVVSDHDDDEDPEINDDFILTPIIPKKAAKVNPEKSAPIKKGKDQKTKEFVETMIEKKGKVDGDDDDSNQEAVLYKSFETSDAAAIYAEKKRDKAKKIDMLSVRALRNEEGEGFWYVCKYNKCGIVRCTERGMKSHQMSHTNQRWECMICDKTFCTKTGLDSCMKAHESEGFTCDICLTVRKSESEMKNHMYGHTIGYAVSCRVKKCPNPSFRIPTDRSRHWTSYHKEFEYNPEAFQVTTNLPLITREQYLARQAAKKPKNTST